MTREKPLEKMKIHDEILCQMSAITSPRLVSIFIATFHIIQCWLFLCLIGLGLEASLGSAPAMHFFVCRSAFLLLFLNLLYLALHRFRELPLRLCKARTLML